MIDLQGFGDQLAFGALMTLEIALGALGLGLVLGLLGAGAKLSRHAPLRMIGETYTTLVRGIPELLVVLIVFFGATIALNSAARGLGFDTYIDVSPYLAGVLALGLTFGAYATEVLRGAFQAVPKGQIEAAHALGMSGMMTLWRVQLPQIWRFALPGLGNLFLVLLKDTSLISVIGLEELMRKSQVAVSFTKDPFTFYAAAAVIYLAMTAVSTVGIQMLEKRANRGIRREGLA